MLLQISPVYFLYICKSDKSQIELRFFLIFQHNLFRSLLNYQDENITYNSYELRAVLDKLYMEVRK